MDELIRLGIFGLVSASIYFIAASGLVLTYQTTGIFNVAHGAVGMLAAFMYWQLSVDWGWPVWLSLVVVVGVLAPGLGAKQRLFTDYEVGTAVINIDDPWGCRPPPR